MAAFEADFGGLTTSDVAELKQLACDEVFIYKVPPLAQAGGHRADNWNLGSPLLTGSLEVVQVGEECYIRLFEPTKRARFATCPVRVPKAEGVASGAYEAVIDSSRLLFARR